MRSALAVLALGTAILVPVEATAEGEQGIYGGLSAGEGQLRDGTNICDSIAQSVGGTVSICDAKSPALRIFGGYQFNSYLAAETGYAFLGGYDISGTVGTAPFVKVAKATAFDLTGVARLPLGERFSIFAKGGAAWYRAGVSTNSGGATAPASAKGIIPTYGLGGSWQPWDPYGYYHLAFRLEWQRFQDVGNPNTTGQSNVDFFSISIVIF